MRPTLLYVITRLCVGGAQLSVQNLCRDLQGDFDVHVACGPDVGDEGSIYEEVAAEFPTTLVPELRRPLRPVQDVRVVGILRRLYGEVGADLVHTHSSKAGIVGRLATRGCGLGVVHTVHGWGHTPVDPWPRKKAFVLAERRAARCCDRIFTVSGDVRDEGLQLGIGRPEQYEVVPETVDFSPSSADFAEARDQARTALGLPSDAEVVGFVGRFMAQKDPETLTRAVAALLDRRPGLHACLVGDGPQREEVERALRVNGHGDRVHFPGFRKDVRSLYAAFDVLLHTSRWEGRPRVPQEAIAERVPVVTARVSGTHELIGAGPVGFEVAVGDADAFAARATEVLEDPDLRAPLSDAAVDSVARLNSRERSLARHREVYSELLALKGRPA